MFEVNSPAECRAFVLTSAWRFLTAQSAREKLSSLPVPNRDVVTGQWMWIGLPPWAADLVPSNKQGLFVPKQDATGWRDYDWWAGAAAMLCSAYERCHEAKVGPIHSYAFRLGQDVQAAFDHAWVNRVILFLQRWWAHENREAVESVFGSKPRAIVHLTHDVDAVSKTFSIRGKQTAFCLYNKRYRSALRFLFGSADYWQFDKIMGLESKFGRRSLWNFYGGDGGVLRRPKEQLMDPAYCVSDSRLSDQLKRLVTDGHMIGLHPKFGTWADPVQMRIEKRSIERTAGIELKDVRQHWLRFSYADTWRAQSQAGLSQDYTLGFNDRIGFRNSAALSFRDHASGMKVIPMGLMDSHLYDYAELSADARFQKIDGFLDELVATGGETSIIWHQRVFHPDYDWGEGYEYLLEGLKDRRIAAPDEIAEYHE